MRRGLVLEGGGAKGAYEIGCLQALRVLRIQIHVVAGSSVGALNAALFACGKLDSGAQVFESLSRSKIIRYSGRFTTILLLPFVSIGTYFHRLLGAATQRPRNAFMRFIDIANIALYPLSLVILAMMIGGVNRYGLVFTLLAVMFLLCLYGPHICDALSVNLLNSSGLRQHIERVLSDEPCHIPTYVTLARRVDVFDPDRPASTAVLAPDVIDSFVKVHDHVLWAPSYVRIDSLGPKDRADVLLASAAIPFGLFANVDIGGVPYADGGVADNCPLWPLLDQEDCDEIIVIRTRRNFANAVEKHWQAIDRNIRLAALGAKGEELYVARHGSVYMQSHEPPHSVRNVPPLLPLRPFPSLKGRIIVIAPSSSLGGFWTGTMRFRGAYAERARLRGYVDTLKQLGNGVSRLRV